MILVNGEPRSEVSAMDRGLAYGDGVFRTFPAYGGHARQWQRQYAKLARDGATLGLNVPEADILEADVKRVSAHMDRCAVKIIVTRGAGARGYRYRDQQPTRIVSAGPLPDDLESHRAAGVRVRLCSLRLAQQPALAGVKHLNRLENVLARAEWSDPGIAEGILCDTQGHVIAGTMTNVFIAAQGALATPRLEKCGVAGVTRDRVMEAAEANGVSCSVTALSWSDVLRADEVFLVNSVIGVWPVRDLEGEARNPGPMTRAVQRWLEEDRA